MCGVFGFVGVKGQRVSLPRLVDIAAKTEERGPHAFGFSWIDGRGRLRCFKSTGRITQALDSLQMAADARLLIGHTRYATQGDPQNNLNNHPHPVDGGWLVHNGMIRSYHHLIDVHGLQPVTGCDSELLGLLIEQSEGTLTERCLEAASIAGDSPLVMLAIWRSPQRLVAVRAGNPLYWGQAKTGFYLGSFPAHIPDAEPVPDDSALSFSVSKNTIHVKHAPLPTPSQWW